MRLTNTSTQRTYRYLRLSLVGAAFALAVAVVQVLVTVGPVVSISATFYTPARDVFVGVLFAISLALIALSGHSWEQVLLDLAALFAPMMAVVPTTVTAGSVPGLDPGCPAPCVPADAIDGIRLGMTTLVIVAVAGLATAVVLGVVQRTLGRGEALALTAAAIIVAGAAWWAVADPHGFVLHGHDVAAACFFALLAAAAVVSAIAAHGRWRVAYAAIATLMVLDLLWLMLVRDLLPGESIALALFAVFWLVQTVERWNEIDPAGILPTTSR